MAENVINGSDLPAGCTIASLVPLLEELPMESARSVIDQYTKLFNVQYMDYSFKGTRKTLIKPYKHYYRMLIEYVYIDIL